MKAPYTAPERDKTSFHCPHCGAFSEQRWASICRLLSGDIIYSGERDSSIMDMSDWGISKCSHCEKCLVWVSDRIIFPDSSVAPMPHPDMPDAVCKTYNEARDVCDKSPRAAAALLRLAIQELMPILGQQSGNLNADIGKLVENGLPREIQQSLDALRVIGNHAVHPGEINLDDKPEVANMLFNLINFVIEDRISKPKEIEKLYESLPDSAKEQINKRDNKVTIDGQNNTPPNQ